MRKRKRLGVRVTVPQDLFDGEVPNRDSVLGQGFWFDPVDRRRRLPDEAMWPPELDEWPTNGICCSLRRIWHAQSFRFGSAKASQPPNHRCGLSPILQHSEHIQLQHVGLVLNALKRDHPAKLVEE